MPPSRYVAQLPSRQDGPTVGDPFGRRRVCVIIRRSDGRTMTNMRVLLLLTLLTLAIVACSSGHSSAPTSDTHSPTAMVAASEPSPTPTANSTQNWLVSRDSDGLYATT